MYASLWPFCPLVLVRRRKKRGGGVVLAFFGWVSLIKFIEKEGNPLKRLFHWWIEKNRVNFYGSLYKLRSICGYCVYIHWILYIIIEARAIVSGWLKLNGREPSNSPWKNPPLCFFLHPSIALLYQLATGSITTKAMYKKPVNEKIKKASCYYRRGAKK